MNAAPDPSDKAAVLVISSLVARGSVGARASAFALERHGHPVWLVPTVWLPWHPGQGEAPRIVPDGAAFQASLDAMAASDKLGEIGAVLTGYLGDGAQAAPIGRLIDAVRAANPDVLVVVDPVSADERGPYVPEAVLDALRGELLPRADVLTPNRFELAALSGLPAGGDPAQLAAAARRLGIGLTVVTSALGIMRGAIGALSVSAREAILAEHAAVPDAPHGTGDLFAALLTAHMLAGANAEEALTRATSSVFDIIARTVRRGGDELLIAAEQTSLIRSLAMVRTRRIVEPAQRA